MEQHCEDSRNVSVKSASGSKNELPVVPRKGWNNNIIPQVQNEDRYAREFRDKTRSSGQSKNKHDDYENGKVRYATEEGKRSLLSNISKVDDGTGMIFNEDVTISINPPFDLGVELRPENDCRKMSGTFGEVIKYKDKKTRVDVAVKKVKRKKFNTSEANIPCHKHICKVFGLIVLRDTICLLLSHSGETLDRYLKDATLTESQIVDLAVQGLEGLKHLSQHGVKHLDIKPNNICVKIDADGKLTLVFIDFGTARFSHEAMPSFGFTPFYLSPELCKYLCKMDGVSLNCKIDVYAFALVIMYMCRKQHVMMVLAEQSLEKRIPQDKIQKEKKYKEMICNDSKLGHKAVEMFGMEKLKSLLLRMTEFSPDERISAEKALKMAKQIQSEESAGMVPCDIDRAIFKDKPPEKREYETLNNDLGSQAIAGLVPALKRSKPAEPVASEDDKQADLERLPELPSLFDRENSTLVLPESSGSGKGNIPDFSKLIDSE